MTEESNLTTRDFSGGFLTGSKLKLTDQKNINLTVPYGYHNNIRRIWYYYKNDPLFGYLVDREVDFAISNIFWDMPWSGDTRSLLEKLWDKVKDISPKRKDKEEIQEEKVWEEWSKVANQKIPNVLGGLNEFLKWVAKSLLLTGMAACEWNYEEVQIGRRGYQLPTKIAVHPSSSVRIQRYSNKFLEEDFYIYIPVILKQEWAWKHEIVDNFNDPSEAKGFNLRHKWLETVGQKGKENAFVLRFNWSPSDLSSQEIEWEYSNRSDYAQGVSSYIYLQNESNSYPLPIFRRLLPALMLREQLFASDASILDGIINLITIFKYGTDEHPANPSKRDEDGKVISGKEGDLYWLKKTIESSLTGNAVNLYLDHRTEVGTLERDTSSLLSNEKYLQSTIEILQFFGIFGSNWTGRTRFEEVNASSQEERVKNLRTHVLGLMHVLIDQTKKKNSSLIRRPNPVFAPINIRPVQWWELMRDLRKMGQISNDDLLRQVGLNQDAVISRMARELQSGIKRMQDEASPVQFTQTTVNPKTEEKKVEDSKKDGRPEQRLKK